ALRRLLAPARPRAQHRLRGGVGTARAERQRGRQQGRVRRVRLRRERARPGGAPTHDRDRAVTLPDPETYDARWAEMERRGLSIHGEADFVAGYAPRSVLDAGCGTGRVAIELARRGVDVVGVDRDQQMVDAARAKAPELRWQVDDLAVVDLG